MSEKVLVQTFLQLSSIFFHECSKLLAKLSTTDDTTHPATQALSDRCTPLHHSTCRWAPLPDASQPPVRGADIRPPSQGSPAPFRRPSIWRNGHEDSPSSKSDKKEDKKEEVKSQLESITGRMFAVSHCTCPTAVWVVHSLSLACPFCPAQNTHTRANTH